MRAKRVAIGAMAISAAVSGSFIVTGAANAAVIAAAVLSDVGRR